MKRIGVACAVCMIVLLVAGQAFSGKNVPPSETVAIVVSPNVLVIGVPGACVTVHTNLPYGSVVADSVELSGVPAYLTKADNLGCFVAKFERDAIEAIVAPPSATLTLTGVKTDGEAFAASDTIGVK
ncbi:MAG: hypothetical protein HQ592_07645 [Planctomycetes bacterium]|nr:hypothetical protein [Planctomycetota bacterium]